MYSWASVSLKEGKNREVKRLMEHLGLKVARLIRVQFGPFHLGHLAEGAVEEIPARSLARAARHGQEAQVIQRFIRFPDSAYPLPRCFFGFGGRPLPRHFHSNLGK